MQRGIIVEGCAYERGAPSACLRHSLRSLLQCQYVRTPSLGSFIHADDPLCLTIIPFVIHHSSIIGANLPKYAQQT